MILEARKHNLNLGGGFDVNHSLREITLTLMEEHQVEPLSETVEQELEAILATET